MWHSSLLSKGLLEFSIFTFLVVLLDSPGCELNSYKSKYLSTYVMADVKYLKTSLSIREWEGQALSDVLREAAGE